MRGRHVSLALLMVEFGRDYSPRNLFSMTHFAEVFRDETIVHALSAQLSWTHLRRMIYIDDPPKRDFYMEMCRVEGWSTRMSEREIAGMRPRLFAILIHGLGLEP